MYFKIECVTEKDADKALNKAMERENNGVIAASRYGSALVVDIEEDSLGALGCIQAAGSGYSTRCSHDDIASLREEWRCKYNAVRCVPVCTRGCCP